MKDALFQSHRATRLGERVQRQRGMRNAYGKPDAGETVIARYEYDALNRRTKEFVNADTDDDFDSFRHFYYTFGWQLLETRLSDSENTDPETLQPEYQYIWSLRYIDAAVLRDKNTDTDDLCDDERLYYLNDANMNVTCLVEDDGDVAERYVYDPYGNATAYSDDWSTTVAWAASKKNNIRYCGYYFDNETGLYSVRYRYYDPPLGRWLSRDPLIPQPIGNLYSYVGDRPTDQRDPLGLSALTDSVLAATVAGTYIERAGRGPAQRVRNWMGNAEDDLRVRVVNAVASLLLRENSQLRALLDSKMRDFAADLCEAGPPIFYTESVPEETFPFNSQPLSGVLGTGRLSGTMTGSVSEVSNCECGLFKVDATWTYKDVIQFMDWASAYQNGWFNNPISGLGAAFEGWLHLNNDTINGASYPLLATWNESISDCCELLEGNP